MNKYAGLVHIDKDVEIGVDPLRIGFIVYAEDERVEWDKAIFKLFRKINIIEYIRPRANLDEKVIRTAVGYGNFYLYMAKQEVKFLENQVTISIFGHSKKMSNCSRSWREKAGLLRMRRRESIMLRALPIFRSRSLL